jgi:hypothetical protein
MGLEIVESAASVGKLRVLTFHAIDGENTGRVSFG